MNVALMIAALVFGASVVEPPTETTRIRRALLPHEFDSLATGTAFRHPKAHPYAHPRSSGFATAQEFGGPPLRNPLRCRFRSHHSDSDAEQHYQYLPPTAAPREAAMGGGRPSGFYGQSRMPYSPTHPRPDQSQANATQNANLTRMKIEASSQAVMPVQQPASKAFSGSKRTATGSALT